MVDGYPIVNYSVFISGLVLCFLGGLMLLVFGKSVERRTRSYFFVFFTILALDMFFNIIAEAQNGNPEETARNVHFAAELLHRVFSPFLAYIVAAYLAELLHKGSKMRAAFLLLSAMCAVYLGFLLIGQAHKLIFTIDENGFFSRGGLYFPLVVLSCMPLIFSIVMLLLRGKQLTKRERVAFWIYNALPAAAVLAQAFFQGMYFIIPATVIAALTMFIFIIVDRTESYYEQEKRQTEMSVAIMLSQIQPHFLFNTLNVICGMADNENAVKTKRALVEFSDYLRVNLKSLDRREPVHFADEKRHTELYLSLEKMSMGSRLNYSFDCETEDFFLPVLTLQPIVENAVLHGVSMKREGGSVRISTKDEGSHIAVTVEDDGAGFQPKPETDNREHIGMQNVRRRLSLQCGGTLSVKSEKDKGTTVTITVPKGGAK